MLFRKYVPAVAIGLVIWVLWLLWLWQPERQVRLHTTHFLQKVQRRNWAGASAFLAEGFSDRWGHNKSTAIQDAREVFGQFIFLTLEDRTDQYERREADATTRTMVKISGQGGPVAQLVMERVNTLREPFSFTWRHIGAAPWNWQLMHIDQSELNIDANNPF
jgi:hypothetical protein